MSAASEPGDSTAALSVPDVLVSWSAPELQERALQLAGRLGVEALSADDVAPDRLQLRVDAQGLALARDGMELRGDLTRMLPRLKQGALQREMLVRAARIKGAEHPVALDATAGLGEDSLLLAASGFEVTLCESDPVIAALLTDALDRAAAHPDLTAAVGRMQAVCADSKLVLRDLDRPLDVVYLDPMFPGRTKSAAVKKKFQLLHHLERPCSDEAELLQAAIDAHPRKIVVKRPVKGPYLAGLKPSHSIQGKAVRYDCLVGR